MKEILYTSLFLIGFSLQTKAQSTLFSIDDSILVEIDPILGKHYKHEIKANQTIYRLAKFFGSSVSEIYDYNEIKAPYTQSLGQLINIPFDTKVLLTSGSKSTYRNLSLLPVYYIAQPGDNLYRISRVYFDQEVEELMKRNQLNHSEISLDQKLLVGWIALPANTGDNNLEQLKKMIAPFTLENQTQEAKGKKEPTFEKEIITNSDIPDNEAEQITKSEEISIQDDTPIDSTDIMFALKNKLYNQDSVQQVFLAEKGIAIWNKEHKDQDNLFVLHRTAKVNSIIELNYPLLQRTAFAKVVGNIPSGVYPDDVSLIISPRVAQSLGARDTRFAIEMKYYE